LADAKLTCIHRAYQCAHLRRQRRGPCARSCPGLRHRSGSVTARAPGGRLWAQGGHKITPRAHWGVGTAVPPRRVLRVLRGRRGRHPLCAVGRGPPRLRGAEPCLVFVRPPHGGPASPGDEACHLRCGRRPPLLPPGRAWCRVAPGWGRSLCCPKPRGLGAGPWQRADGVLAITPGGGPVWRAKPTASAGPGL
jgi:hypothetical protein